MIFLVAVDLTGVAVTPQRYVRDEGAVRAAYEAFFRDLNEDNTDARTRYAIHALDSGQHWRSRDREHVQSDAGCGADRSCNAERCICERLGLPVKTHPHRIAA